MRYFDCNCSYGCTARPPHRFAATPRDLLDEMDFCGIDAAMVFHTNERFASPVTWNSVVVQETQNEKRLHPVWAILPEACGELPPPEQLLEKMRNHGVRALWAFPQEHRYRLDGCTFPQLFRLMARCRIPLFAKESLFQLKELLEACPGLPVVAVNQGPHSLDRHLRPLMDAFPNLHVDTSYLLVEGLIEGMCERYGPERLLFGTAFPDNCSGGALLRLAQAEIGEESRALIAAGNLERLLAWSREADAGADAIKGTSPFRGTHRVDRVGAAAPHYPSEIAAEYMTNGRSERCPLIDMHGHWAPFGGSFLPCASEQNMLESLHRTGVKHIVCSSSDALLADPECGNRVMEKAIARSPDVLSGYWSVNPNYPNLAARAPEDLQKSNGFVGFKFLPDYHAYPVTGDRYRSALEHANEKSLLVLVHTWGGSTFDSPQMLGEVAAKYPRANFLMGHSGYGDWVASVRIARELSNVFLELTAVYAAHDFAMQPNGSGTPLALLSCMQVNGILEYMVSEAGSNKVVFGTDMPWYSPHYAAGAVLYAKISDDARHDILHRNAERLLGLMPKTWDAPERCPAGAVCPVFAGINENGGGLRCVHGPGRIHRVARGGVEPKVKG